MTRIAIELDLPADMIEAAKKQGLLSAQAITELIRREMEKNSSAEVINFNPAYDKLGFQPWLVGKVSPALFGKSQILASDDDLPEPIEADWYAAGGASAPGVEGGDYRIDTWLALLSHQADYEPPE